MTLSEGAELLARLRATIAERIVGQGDAIDDALVVFLARGHLLIEGVPGTAKTLLVRTLAAALGLRFTRIQFTPDLMPSDLTGVSMLRDPAKGFEFQPGPVFTDILLGDEINRAPAKTQAALLEAMAERQVTTDGSTRPLDTLFTVYATQNPVEHEGTYPLPEAQLDRFLLKTVMPYPSRDAELEMLAHHEAGFDPERGGIHGGAPLAERVLTPEQARGLRALVDATRVAADVREYIVAADLARLRTATRGRAADEVFYLNRLVASAHSLLYRRRTLPVRTVLEFLFGDVPREIRRSWRPILLASLLLFGPMAIAGRAVFTNPDVAERLLPATMLDRAEEGVERAKKGTGYIPDPDLYRPLMATSVITNNIQVAFFAFALGITAGVMTLWILLTNGVSIGAAFGLYASKGIGTLLLAFVAPHGVLELFAIVVAGGAGFLLGAAIVLPGERTRGAALVANGARAIRLVAGAALLLLVAGALEGFVSPIATWPLSWKLAVSGASAVVLALYLVGGSRRTRPAPDDLALTVRPAP